MVLPNKKTVSFQKGERLCSYKTISRRRSSQDKIARQWYLNQDYERFLHEIKESVAIAKQEGLQRLIHHHYGYTDSETQTMLNSWTMCQDTRRGLERFVNEDYGDRRLLHRRKTIDAVLYAQEKLRKSNQSGSRAASIIQTVSTTLSANAVAYAKMLAMADCEAAQECNQNSPAAQRPLRSHSAGSIAPKGRSPIAARKHSRAQSSPPRRPPRHPGPRYEIRISPIA